jgi:hypothetical protein
LALKDPQYFAAFCALVVFFSIYKVQIKVAYAKMCYLAMMVEESTCIWTPPTLWASLRQRMRKALRLPG